MLHSTQLKHKLWAEAVNTACYVLNRTGPTKNGDKTPYEAWVGKQAPTDHLKIFGTECFVHVPKQKRQQLDAKSVRGNLLVTVETRTVIGSTFQIVMTSS